MKETRLAVLLLVVAFLLLACANPGVQVEEAPSEPAVEEAQVEEVQEEPEVEEVPAEEVPEEPEAEGAQVEEVQEELGGEGVVSPDPDTLVYARVAEPQGLDPRLNYEYAGNEIIQNVYDRLLTYQGDDPTELVPSLATEWEVSEDGTTYTFDIREGVTFHDGSELTAEDVAYTFQSGLLQGGTASPQWLLTEPFFGVGVHDVAELVDPALADDPEALQAADPAELLAVCEQVRDAIVANEDGSVTMQLATPWAPFLPTLAGSWGSIIDKEWAIEQGAWDGECATWQNFYGVTSENDPLNTITNGTGPYMLETWTPGEEVVLVANPDYWLTEEVGPRWEGGPTGAPAIERVVVQIVPEWGTRFAMLQAGDTDLIEVSPENWPQLDPLVGEICTFAEDGAQVCEPSENPDAPLRMFAELPTVVRSDALFTWNVNTEGGNPYIGSGELDGNGIPADFFSDEHVRKAFNYCFDWETFIADVYQGEAVQSAGVLIPSVLGYEADDPMYSHDLERCAEELEQAWGGQVAEEGFRLQAAIPEGDTAAQTALAILQSNLTEIDPKYQIETVSLPWPSFLAGLQESRLPLYFSGWHEDIHDPHNWAQPFTIGAYGATQAMPEELNAQLEELVNAGVAATDEAERIAIYQQLQELDFELAPAIRGVAPLHRHYEQRWLDGTYYNPALPGLDFYPLSEVGD